MNQYQVRERRVFAWRPYITIRQVFWMQWVTLVEDRRVDDEGRECWELVSVNGVVV